MANKKVIRMDVRNNLKDMVFGHLKVLYDTGKIDDKTGCVVWMCECDCGAMLEISSSKLTSQGQISCGNPIHKVKHGETGTRLYRIWSGMKTRCYNPKSPHYNRYGGRGIIVCDEWKNDYTAFRDWALANGYDDTLTIDRKENDGNYEPSNCRWTTPKEQANNTSSCMKIECNGKVMSLKEWCTELKLNYKTVKSRLRTGWSVQKALGIDAHLLDDCQNQTAVV